MATREQVEIILTEFRKSKPSEHFQNIDKLSAGVTAILQILYEAKSEVTAGDISKNMNVSTARVAVLLRKMSENGLIEKSGIPRDARIVVVNLTEVGKKKAEEINNRVFSQVGIMIDKVGMEKMLEFAAIANELRSILPPPDVISDETLEVNSR